MTERWQAVIYAFRDADPFTLMVLLWFVVLCGRVVLGSCWRTLMRRFEERSDYEPRATSSERGLW